jgi:hypothetical protein
VSGANQQNLVDNVANDFKLAQVMFSAGLEEVPFSLAGENYANEFALCQRYYETGFVRQANDMRTDNSAAVGWQVFYKVPKRATPTIALSNIGGTNSSGGSASNITQNEFLFNWGANASVGGAVSINRNADWSADTEL